MEVPLLPGHGTRWQDLNRPPGATGTPTPSARSTSSSPRTTRSSSAGSRWAALALMLAADRAPRRRRRDRGQPVASTTRTRDAGPAGAQAGPPSFPGIVNDIKKPGVDEHGYHRMPCKAAHSMIDAGWEPRADLPKVTQPLLVFQPEDHVVDPSRTEGARGRLVDRRHRADAAESPTTWPRSTTTPRRSSRSPRTSSPGSPPTPHAGG